MNFDSIGIVRHAEIVPNYFGFTYAEGNGKGKRIRQYKLYSNNFVYYLKCTNTMSFTLLQAQSSIYLRRTIWASGYPHVFVFLYVYAEADVNNGIIKMYANKFCPLNVMELDIL